MEIEAMEVLADLAEKRWLMLTVINKVSEKNHRVPFTYPKCPPAKLVKTEQTPEITVAKFSSSVPKRPRFKSPIHIPPSKPQVLEPPAMAILQSPLQEPAPGEPKIFTRSWLREVNRKRAEITKHHSNESSQQPDQTKIQVPLHNKNSIDFTFPPEPPVITTKTFGDCLKRYQGKAVTKKSPTKPIEKENEPIQTQSPAPESIQHSKIDEDESAQVVTYVKFPVRKQPMPPATKRYVKPVTKDILWLRNPTTREQVAEPLFAGKAIIKNFSTRLLHSLDASKNDDDIPTETELNLGVTPHKELLYAALNLLKAEE
jgi:hypothetical protein